MIYRDELTGALNIETARARPPILPILGVGKLDQEFSRGSDEQEEASCERYDEVFDPFRSRLNRRH